MAHEIYQNETGRASMAYVGDTPWHGLGQRLEADASHEDWVDAAGFDWEIHKAPVMFASPDGFGVVKDRLVLYRSDTNQPISVMSARYREVQPREVLDFFRDVCESQRWALETAGVLGNGAKYWALAKAGPSAFIRGTEHRMYMLLASSADGSLATVAQGTDVRVVCRNTLGMALAQEDGSQIKIRHAENFDPKKVKEQLGMVDIGRSWERFTESMKVLGEVQVSDAEATQFFSELLRPKERRAAERCDRKAHSFAELLDGAVGGAYAPISTDGADLEKAIRGLKKLETCYYTGTGAAPGTAYGLIQGVTNYLDHVRGSDPDKRRTSAWFGNGAAMKVAAMDAALALTDR